MKYCEPTARPVRRESERMAFTPEEVAAREFSGERRGYSRAEVRAFLVSIAEELERQELSSDAYVSLGSDVANIVRTAESTARDLRERTHAQVDEELTRTRAEVQAMRSEADRYAAEVRAEADDYAAQVRSEADHYSSEHTTEADRYAAQVRSDADADIARQLAESRAVSEQLRIDAASELEEAQALSIQIRADADEVQRHIATSITERRTLVDQESSELRSQAAETAARTVADAERRASDLVAAAEQRAASMLESAEDDAATRSTTVLSQAQERLDIMLTAERQVHDRLQAALEDLRAAISKVAGRHPAEAQLTTLDLDAELPPVNWADSRPAEIDLRTPPSEDASAVVRDVVGRALRERG